MWHVPNVECLGWFAHMDFCVLFTFSCRWSIFHYTHLFYFCRKQRIHFILCLPQVPIISHVIVTDLLIFQAIIILNRKGLVNIQYTQDFVLLYISKIMLHNKYSPRFPILYIAFDTFDDVIEIDF
uniref:Uncharacterized protein n=1 Tax=Cacopsylla melanoneura TaxID=428564 RepID=A0A8D8RGG2_9HEMI